MVALVDSRPTPAMSVRSSGTSPRAVWTTTPPRPAPIQRRMLPRMAAGSTSPSLNGVGIGGKTARRFTRPKLAQADKRKRARRYRALFCRSMFEPQRLVNPRAPDHALRLPVLVQDRPD